MADDVYFREPRFEYDFGDLLFEHLEDYFAQEAEAMTKELTIKRGVVSTPPTKTPKHKLKPGWLPWLTGLLTSQTYVTVIPDARSIGGANYFEVNVEAPNVPYLPWITSLPGHMEHYWSSHVEPRWRKNLTLPKFPEVEPDGR